MARKRYKPEEIVSMLRQAECCSARGLRADRHDKLLKLFDTGGQNCTQNNTRTTPKPMIHAKISPISPSANCWTTSMIGIPTAT